MDWKDALKNLAPTGEASEAESTPPAAEVAPEPVSRRGRLRIELDRHGRKGKPVTLISQLQCDDAELVRLTRLLQTRLGTGGSHCFNTDEPYDGQILLQGDCRTKAADLLAREGYRYFTI